MIIIIILISNAICCSNVQNLMNWIHDQLYALHAYTITIAYTLFIKSPRHDSSSY